MSAMRSASPTDRPSTLVLALATLLFAAATGAGAVILDDENVLSVTLDDGTVVRLYGEARRGGEPSRSYHYLPANLRLARRPDGTPQLLFLKYTTEEKAGSGGIQGAILHLLVEWGLEPSQEAELRELLRRRRRGAELVGPVRMEATEETAAVEVLSATLADGELTPTVLHSQRAPLLPGDRAAAAARLSGRGAQLLAKSLEEGRSISDLSLQLGFRYTTLAPAARGTVEIHWDRLAREIDTLTSDYSKDEEDWCFLWTCDDPTYSYEEVREQYRFLESNKIVEVHFEEMVADERTAKIREAFFQYFLDALTVPAAGGKAPPEVEDDGDEGEKERRSGSAYHFRETAARTLEERGRQTFDLEYRMAVRWPHTLTGNLGEWYDAVRDNPRCVDAVNLNDPFFQHREIRFVLDLDSRGMFEEVVNYVTVNVRKRRPGGHPFEGRVTFTADGLAEEGLVRSLTYARGEGDAADAYEYQVQWSLRGGELHPRQPRWRRGSWEGVTLSPPLAGRSVELEGDLAAMEASGVTRVTAQLRYYRFGREVETNLQISPHRGEPLVAQRIYADRDSRGYAYRLIVNHKTHGKLVLPWSPKVGDDYIYAALPPELLRDGSPELDAARTAAEALARGSEDDVLAEFSELLREAGP